MWALGYYHGDEKYRYADVVVNNSPHFRAAWGVRVVALGNLPRSDWKRGARGEGDFWNVVEDEVERRLQDGFGLELFTMFLKRRLHFLD